MELFDQKQEVIDIVVTPYGKHMLAAGRFNPEYYSFFDEDILYDSSYISIDDEVQNDIEGRIQQETPRMKAIPVCTGVETTVNTNVAIIRSSIEAAYGVVNPPFAIQDTITAKIYNQDILQPPADKYAFASMPLGSSELSSDKYPAWNLAMEKGEISSSAPSLAIPKKGPSLSFSSDFRYEQIPQINITLPYKAYVGNIHSMPNSEVLESNTSSIVGAGDTFPLPASIPDLDVSDEIIPTQLSEMKSQVFANGLFIAVKEGRVILNILEENTSYKKENFDIEVFMSSSQYSAPDGSPQLLYYANNELDIYTSDEVEKYMVLRTDRSIKDAQIQGAPFEDITGFSTSQHDTEIISTREFLIRDLYKPEKDICD